MNPIIIILGIISAIIIFISPFIGLLATVALIPLSAIQAFGSSVLGIFTIATPIKMIGGLTFISAFVRHILTRKNWQFIKKPQSIFFILFLTWIIFLGFLKPGEFTRENFTAFVSFAFLGFCIISLTNNFKKIKWIIWAGILSVLFASLISIFDYFKSTELIRVSGMGYGPNEFAIGLLPFMGIAFYNIFAEKKVILKITSLLITVFITIVLVLTFSRGGILGFFAMLLIATIKSKKKIRAILSLLVVIVMLINFMPAHMWERYRKTQIAQGATGDEAIDSATRRFFLAKAAWQMFLVNPIFGVGPGNYYYDCRIYQPLVAGRAHNMYLEIMAELGIIGIILFLGILYYTFKTLKKIRKGNIPVVSSYARGLYIGLIGFLIAAIFLHAQQEKQLWFVIFMTLALEKIYYTQMSTDKNKDGHR